MSVVLYTMGCPKCEVLRKKLEKKGIEYEQIDSIQTFKEKGIEEFPMLSIDDGPLMNFKEANTWVNNWRE